MSREQSESNPAEFLNGIDNLLGKTARYKELVFLPHPKQNLDNQCIGEESRLEQHGLRRFYRQATLFALTFVVLCVLVAVGATQSIDLWVQVYAHAHASYPLDVITSLVTTLGGAEITCAITLLLSLVWWQRRGIRGLAPLLLFVGIGIEIVLKYYLPHPGPPSELARGFHYLAFFQFPTPFSFPSGHALRVAFLVALINVNVRSPRWRVAGWIAVVAVALTRLYLNIHSVSDVVGGILLGLALATVAAGIGAEVDQKPMIER